jgi:hypothetical protein
MACTSVQDNFSHSVLKGNASEHARSAEKAFDA